MIEYKFDRKIENLPEEAEIHRRGEAVLLRRNAKSKPYIIRRGLPQGLSFSPLLSTVVLELPETPKGLIMYADDGLVITDMEETKDLLEVRNYFAILQSFGLNLE